jgi:hypothetical protein
LPGIAKAQFSQISTTLLLFSYNLRADNWTEWIGRRAHIEITQAGTLWCTNWEGGEGRHKRDEMTFHPTFLDIELLNIILSWRSPANWMPFDVRRTQSEPSQPWPMANCSHPSISDGLCSFPSWWWWPNSSRASMYPFSWNFD